MQILNIRDNQELQSAKNFMFWSLISYIICCFVVVIPFVNILAFIGIIASFVVGMIGLYKFSKLCNTFVFRLFLFSFLLGIGFQITSWVLGFLAGFNESAIPLAILGVLAIGYYALIIYWAYLMSYEMSARTNLKEFIVSFKLSIIAIIGMVACVGVLFGLFASVLLEAASEFGGLENLSSYRLESVMLVFVDSYTATLIAIGGLCVFLVGVAIASFVFSLMGLYKIQEVSVREVNICKLEKTSNAGD
ncbi:hypothetical protein CQA49_02520 [Helicobacter sp. MIT 00-7814]|uniref:hypothetical protein n=1 Tax=unclassified Helicobacter TaxID=2593540 RepID=UPI000E1F9E11|nr:MULTISPECIES: hypothetical protein [unclassified Helicobacter]RDU55261.1 hypothetical protein CQA37_04210 [Helicobacter sp. MIT 99-10781]RDU56099.1 hypothetical protein CQA49_02520 [Helicobacter sp. MIT 00-7814]